MGYNLLGRAVWMGAKWYLRRRFGIQSKQAAAALLVAGGIAAVLVAQRRSGSA